MATETSTGRKFDVLLYRKNHSRIPPEYYDQFRGQKVAWHMDGTHVVAAADTSEVLYERLKELGVGTDEVVFACIDDSDGQF